MTSEETDYEDGQDLLLGYSHDEIMNELGYGDEDLIGNTNNQMMMLISSIMGESGQVASLPMNMDEFHALAKANLISQTQEAIIKEYNIDMESPDLFGTSFANLEPVLPTHLESYTDSSDSLGNTDNVSHLHRNSDMHKGVIESKEQDGTKNLKEIELLSPDHQDNVGQITTDKEVWDQWIDESVTACNKTKDFQMSEEPADISIETRIIDVTDEKSVSVCEMIDKDIDGLSSTCNQIKNKSSDIEKIVNKKSQKRYTNTDNQMCNKVGNHTLWHKDKSNDNIEKDSRHGCSLQKQTKVKINQEIVIKGDGIMCDFCGKLFRNKKGLHNHMTTHNPLCCPLPGCDRKFSYPSHYKYHLLTHSQERNFVCDCGKTFYTSQQLEVHQRSHNSEKPFTCDQCQKSFTTAGNLRNHQRLHTGERPFVCTVNGCGKSFAEDSSLRKHILTHSGSKPYKCGLCNKGFTQSSSRSYHMKHKHPQNVILSSRTETNIGVT